MKTYDIKIVKNASWHNWSSQHEQQVNAKSAEHALAMCGYVGDYRVSACGGVYVDLEHDRQAWAEIADAIEDDRTE